MTALRCTQKLLTAMRAKPVAPGSTPCTSRLGEWTMNLLHVRPVKLVLAVSEHDRLALLLEAAPFSTLTQRFPEALFAHLLTLGVPPDMARAECNAMQPFSITTTGGHANRLSIQGNMNEYTKAVEWGGEGLSLAEMNARLSQYISKPIGYQFPGELVKKRLCLR